MPELPEVETMRRGILGTLGSRITDVARLRCSRKPIGIHPGIAQFRRRAVERIDQLSRVGKRVAIELDTDDVIVIEPRMTGLILVADPPTDEHLRWRLTLSGGPVDEVYYWDRRGLGSVSLFSPRAWSERFGPDRLGPDALQITAQQYQRQLGRSRRQIKPALLDQRAVAGIGNLYASEILHRAGIHPLRQCTAMTKRQWQALAEASRAVLSEAIKYEGSTLGDGTYRNALNKEGGYQNKHQVYNKAGRHCPRCRVTAIQRIVQTQRSTFFCPKCQKRSGARGLSVA